MDERKQPWLFCHEKTLAEKERNSCLGKAQEESPIIKRGIVALENPKRNHPRTRCCPNGSIWVVFHKGPAIIKGGRHI
jgi:hypothetical protein